MITLNKAVFYGGFLQLLVFPARISKVFTYEHLKKFRVQQEVYLGVHEVSQTSDIYQI